MTESLLPPEAHRGKRGYHWIENVYTGAKLHVEFALTLNIWKWWIAGEAVTPEWAAQHWRYHAPCAGPDAAGELENLRMLLKECEETLKLAEPLAHPDMDYIRDVTALGERMGYGNMMASASALWRLSLQQQGIGGGEFVFGPCRSTLTGLLRRLRTALTAYRAQREGEKAE